MTPEEILSHPPKVLTEEQRAFYFDQGYLLLERFLPEPWIDRLRQTTDEVIADSRAISESDADAAAIDPAKVKYLDGPAGSMTIHGSKPNSAATGRPRGSRNASNVVSVMISTMQMSPSVLYYN